MKTDNKDLAKKLRQKYEGFGWCIKNGDKFWKTKKGWGWQVGEYSHSCHIDTTDFVVVMLIDDKTYQSSVEEFDSLWMKSITV